MLQTRASRWTFGLFGCFALAIACAATVNAQNNPQPRVVGFPVTVAGGAPRLDPTATAGLGDRVSVRVEAWPSCSEPQASMPAPQSAANTGQPASPADNNSASQTGDQNSVPYGEEPSWIPGLTHAQVLKLVPYLNARPLTGVYPETVDPGSHTLTFHLRRTPASKEAWTDLLSNPGFEPRVMTFSVGLEDKQQFPTCVAKFNLVVIPVKWFVVAIALFLVVLYIFFRLAAGTALLRDPGISQGYMPGFSVLWRRGSADTRLGPFSLARTQMAFWFFMVIGAFVLIWMITGNTDTITEGVLVLIGISAGTALGATAIDSGKRNTTTTRPRPGDESKGLLNDLLGDGTGITFHRFQIVVWTIVLGLVFARSVMSHLAMPDFGTSLLTLMGISSGTYLGMKLPEQQAPESPPVGGQTQSGAGGAAGSPDQKDQQGQQNGDEADKAGQKPESAEQAAQG
ncbi:MAG: hypothetical protein AABN34_03585 [Acidobacteriota bacterium]